MEKKLGSGFLGKKLQVQLYLLESINLTFAIDAHEERDVMIADVPNAFVQTWMPSELLEENNRIIMKIKGVLVDILYTLDPLE